MALANGPVPTGGFPLKASRIVSPRLFATGGMGPAVSTDFTDATPVITEIYLAEIYIAAPCSPTGIANFNGSNVTDSVKLALYDDRGVLLAATADTQCSGADAYQRIPFATNASNATFTSIRLLPGTYYVGAIYDGTTSRYNAHTIGNFAAGKLTGHVYATAFNTTGLTIVPPTTFTTALGPVASLY